MWHEARRSERKVHELMDAARRRAERRAVFLAKRRGDPQQALRLVGTRSRLHHDPAMYQAVQDQQGLIPWNGKPGNLIDRFDGRALLDFIRESDGRPRNCPREKTEEEHELEELVNFERYRDLIKHKRRGLNDEEGLQDVEQEIEARAVAPFVSDRRAPQATQPGKGTYAQVGFAYETEGREEDQLSDSDEDDDEDDADEVESSSDDSEDEEMESIGKEYGVQRFNWLLYMDRKVKEEEKKQKEAAKGDPAMRKLSRKERRKFSQQEREREKECVHLASSRFTYHDPYRESRGSPTYEAYSRSRRERSRSCSPALSRSRWQDRHDQNRDFENSSKRNKTRPPAAKIEYITEFSGAVDEETGCAMGVALAPSPPSQVESFNRHSSGQILEALHTDPAASAITPFDKDRNHREPKVVASKKRYSH